jgi:lipid-binding SYLF domain-containing protein
MMKTKIKLAVASSILMMSGTLLASSFNEVGSKEDRIENKANKTLVRSVQALDNIMESPENYIPPSMIIQAEGIVILPGAFKMAVGVAGGQGARGIAMIRETSGSWSNPFFVTLGEGSFGLQFGAQKSDIVLLFKDRNDLLELHETELTLGGDVGVAAGPLSRGASAITDIKFESEIYTYSNSNGLFAGVSFKGGVLTYNNKLNDSLYGMDNVSTDEIVYESETPYYENVIDLIDTVNSYGE